MKILGFAGRSQSGKTTACNWLSGLWLQRSNLIDSHFVDDFGNLWVPVELDGALEYKLIQFNRETIWLRENAYSHVKQYSFADTLKIFLAEVYGGSWDNYYGTNEQKSQPTHLKWENFPDFIRKKYGNAKKALVNYRELMQLFGTDIVRASDVDAWVRPCLNRISVEQPDLALISDCRFPNEVTGIQAAGGKVIKFTRNPHNLTHSSETALDPENFDQNLFDAVIDNSQLSITEQNAATIEVLKTWEWSDFEFVEYEPPKKEEILPPTRNVTTKIKRGKGNSGVYFK